MANAISNRRVVIGSAVGGIALIAFVLASLAPLNHNDFMYALAPAVWAQHGALYTDVPFVQAPLTILLNALLAAVTGNVNIFLPGRIVSILLVLAAVLLPVLGRTRRAGLDVWVLYVALCLTNLFVVTNSSEIGNYSISLLFLSAAVTAIDAPGSAAWRGFVVCLCAGLAVSTKLYFVILCPGLLICFLLSGRSAREPRALLACMLGFLAGFALVLFFVARDYHSFLRWNVQIHQLILPTRVTDLSDAVARIGKFTVPFAALMAIPIGFVAAAAVRALRQGGDAMRQACGRLVLLASAALMAVSPVYVFEQYFGPLAFLLLLFAAPWDAPRNATRAIYVTLAGVMLAMQAIVLAQVSSKYVLPDRNLAVAQVLALQRDARAGRPRLQMRAQTLLRAAAVPAGERHPLSARTGRRSVPDVPARRRGSAARAIRSRRASQDVESRYRHLGLLHRQPGPRRRRRRPCNPRLRDRARFRRDVNRADRRPADRTGHPAGLPDAAEALTGQPLSRCSKVSTAGLIAMPPTTLDHCVIHVSEWARSNKFYTEVIGAELVQRPAGWAYRLGDKQLNVHGPGVTPAEVARTPVLPGNSDLCFEWSGPIEDAIAHLKTHGIAIDRGPLQRFGAKGPGTSVYFRDPDGSLMEFMSYEGMSR